MKYCLFVLFAFLLNTINFAQKTFTLLDRNVSVGQIYTTHQIYFDLSGSNILKESIIIVDSIFTFLNSNKNVEIEIQHHCDSRSPDSLSNRLSMYRAETITNYLVRKGINRDRLTPKGYGKTKLLITDEQISQAKNKKEKEALHAINRRVVLEITSINHND